VNGGRPDPATSPIAVETAAVDALRRAGATVATAESLTGGLVAAALTAVPGASSVVRGGVVVYATDLKATLAGVPTDVLEQDGPVAASTVGEMAEGIRKRCAATYGVATTGVAGPDRQDGHPPGTFHVAVAGPGGVRVQSFSGLAGDRAEIRGEAVRRALDLLIVALDGGRESAAAGTR
jgi:nicotinamide-nucleotide amidase